MDFIKNKLNVILTILIVIACGVLGFSITLNKNITADPGYKNRLPKIGAVIYSYEDTFLSYVRSSMEDEALGTAALNISDSQNNQSKQLKQIDKMIQDKVKVIAVNLVDKNFASDVIAKAKAANIPVIFFNKEPDSAVLKSYSKAWYVGTNSVESGILQGQMIANLWKLNPQWDKDKDGILSYVMLKGQPGHPDAEARSKYAIEEIQREGIEVKELANYSAMWDTVQARDKMDQWIQQFGDSIEFVISNNDAMALGAAISLNKYGFLSEAKFIPVAGVDAIPEVVNKINSVQIVGTILNDAKSQAVAVIQMATNLAEGREITYGTNWSVGNDKSVRIHYISITKENIDVAIQAYK